MDLNALIARCTDVQCNILLDRVERAAHRALQTRGRDAAQVWTRVLRRLQDAIFA